VTCCDLVVEIILPLAGTKGSETVAASEGAVIEDFPSELGVAVAVIKAVDPRAELVFSPGLVVVSRDALAEVPDPIHHVPIIGTLRNVGGFLPSG